MSSFQIQFIDHVGRNVSCPSSFGPLVYFAVGMTGWLRLSEPVEEAVALMAVYERV